MTSKEMIKVTIAALELEVTPDEAKKTIGGMECALTYPVSKVEFTIAGLNFKLTHAQIEEALYALQKSLAIHTAKDDVEPSRDQYVIVDSFFYDNPEKIIYNGEVVFRGTQNWFSQLADKIRSRRNGYELTELHTMSINITDRIPSCGEQVKNPQYAADGKYTVSRGVFNHKTTGDSLPTGWIFMGSCSGPGYVAHELCHDKRRLNALFAVMLSPKSSVIAAKRDGRKK